jgi:hypothetical protein
LTPLEFAEIASLRSTGTDRFALGKLGELVPGFHLFENLVDFPLGLVLRIGIGVGIDSDQDVAGARRFRLME